MSDFLINYFQLEDKYPKLSTLLKLRRKFQNYNLILNFSLIFIFLFALLYADIQLLMLYLL